MRRSKPGWLLWYCSQYPGHCVVFLWHEVLHARWMEILKAVMHFIFYYTYDSVLPRPRFSDILAKKIQMSHTKSSRGAICHLRPDWERIPNKLSQCIDIMKTGATKQNKVDTSIFIGRNLFKLDWNAVFVQWNWGIHALTDKFALWRLRYRKGKLEHFGLWKWLQCPKPNKNCRKK